VLNLFSSSASASSSVTAPVSSQSRYLVPERERVSRRARSPERLVVATLRLYHAECIAKVTEHSVFVVLTPRTRYFGAESLKPFILCSMLCAFFLWLSFQSEFCVQLTSSSILCCGILL